MTIRIFFLLSSIVVIVLLGIISVLLYNFFITSSNEIRTISLQGVINGSKIQTFNMKNIIEDKFQIITSNLKLLGDSPLQEEEHTLEESICRPLIGTENYMPHFLYCKICPKVENINLISIEDHIGLKDPRKHKAKL